MARGAQQEGRQAVKQANTTAGNYGSQATQIGSTLVPELTQEATHPTGYNPTDLNNTLVAGEQGAGGATGGITGQANLQAARTHNTGALSGVLDQAARQKQQALSQNALGVQNQNAMLKERQRQAGLGALESMYGTNVGAQEKAMSLVPEDINAELNAGNQGWLQNTLGTISTLAGAARNPVTGHFGS